MSAKSGGKIKMEDSKNRQEIYSGKIIKVYKDMVELPNKKIAEREIVLHGECSAVLAVKNKKVVFVRQYRHAIKNYSLEIPAGIMEKGESPEDCAKRELEEETGLVAKKLFFMFKMYSSIGFCNELLNIFMANNFSVGKQNFDDDEFITLEEYSLEQAKNLIQENKITDSKTIAAIFAYDFFKDKFI